MRRGWVAGASLVLLSAAGLAIRYTEAGCGMLGWHWGSVPAVCFTPLCHYSGGCGTWVKPMVQCESIEPKTPFAKVHFILGDPTGRREDWIQWGFGKPDQVVVEVLFKDGKVQEVRCPAGY